MQNVNPPEFSQADAGPEPTLIFNEGERLAGCYVLHRCLQSAPASPVWLAQDEALGKEVALFFIPQAVREDAAAMESLRHDVRRARQSVHPNILRVYDLVEEQEWAAIAAESFQGQTLAAIREARPSGVFEAADVKPWLSQLLQTMQDAHRVQLVHGDLSLANLILVEGGRLLVANFGSSRSIKDALARKNAGTSQPQAQPASPADDVYATGLLFHELLAGAAPFGGEEATLRQSVPPTMLDHRSQLGKAGGPIPPGWEKVVSACLEKTADARPKNFAEISSRLGLDKSETSDGPAEEPAQFAADWSKENAVDDDYPAANGRRSGFPLTTFAAAALLIAFCVYALFFRDKGETGKDEGQLASETSTDRPELTAVANRLTDAPRVEAPAATSVPATPATPIAAIATPLPAVPVRVSAPVPALQLAANTKPKTATPVPAKSDTPAKPANPLPDDAASPAVGGDPALNEKLTALQAAQKSAEATDKMYQDLVQQREQADAALATSKKGLQEKTLAAAPALKSLEELAVMRQQRDAELRTAEAAAQEAQKIAAEKVRLADQARKAVAQTEVDGKSKAAAQQKMEAELGDLKKAITDREKTLADLAKRLEGVQSKKAEQLAAVKQSEQEVAQAKAAAQKAAEDSARRAAEMEVARKAQEEKRAMIQKEMEDARRLFEERMKALEAALKTPDPVVPPAPAPVVPTKTEVLPKPSPVPPADPVKPEPPPNKAQVAPPKPAAPVVVNEAPQLPPADSTLLAKADAPVAMLPRVETNRPDATPPPAPAPANAGFTNSLGMKFVPVGDLSFCIWQTRVRDFEAFASATGLKSNLWRDPGFKQAPDHPVVNISWLEAVAFCKWLTFKEQREGVLQASQSYRLPTDVEWSKAVGLPDENGKNPEARDMGVPDVYPWGTQWPPPSGAGNYTGEETGSDVAIKGYDDGFAWTSPVGSFAANQYGLYDMGGNVWQWVMDAWSTDPKAKVLRGASWYNGALKLSLLSSCRVHAAQDSSTDNYGFRCVLAADKSSKR